MTETDTTAIRKKMLVGLSEDLAAAGWDQPNKLWMILGEKADEYLEYVGSYEMDSPHWMMHRAEEGTLREAVRGVATCFESWTYPEALSERLNDNTVSTAFKFLVPPDEHPECNSLRTIVMVTRDGLVMRADRRSIQEAETETAIMDEVEPTGATGDDLVDYMRAMLGINEPPPKHPLVGLVAMVSGDAGEALKNLLIQGATQGWDQTRISAEVYKAAPEEVRKQLDATMPEDVRRYLDEHPEHPE